MHARNVDLQQLETLALQDRGLTGRLNADAKISGTTGGAGDRRHGGDRQRRRSRPTTTIRCRRRSTTRGTRIGLDATLQQSPTEAITAKGTVPTSAVPGEPGQRPRRARARRRDRSAGQVDCRSSLGDHRRGSRRSDQRHRHARGRRPRRRLGQDPHVAGICRHQERRLQRAGGRRHVLGPHDADRSRSRDRDADPGVPAARSAWREADDRRASWPCTSGRSAAVNINVDSDNFELLDNELGDVQVAGGAEDHRRAAPAADRRRRPGSTRPASRSTRCCSCSTTRIRSRRCPTSSSAERQVEGSGSAEEATQRRCERQRPAAPATPQRGAPGDAPQPAAARRAGSTRSRSTSTWSFPTTWCCAARTSAPAGRPERRSAT